jgi:OOP family OmpA-OmpF porin
MKKGIRFITLMAMVFPLLTIAQEKYQFKKGGALGIHFTLHDFKSGAILKNEGLSELLLSKQFSRVGDMNAGFAISFAKGLTDNIDIMPRLGVAFLKYPLPNKPNQSSGSGALVEADVNLNVKLTSDQYWVSPFISLGLGASQWKGYYGAYAPFGLGLQLNLWDETFITAQTQYRQPLSGNTNNHLFHSLGIAGNIARKKEVAPPPPPIPTVEPPKDTDGDGIIDAEDACPTVAGLAQFKGCPDTDKDGIADNEDKCPTVAGLPKYNGCPIPDTDNDGINDEEDKCPTVAGLARYNGCPIPDRDNDGVNDEEDNCPDIAGPAENKGCPVIAKERFNGSNITFHVGSARLTPEGMKELDKGIKIVTEEYPSVNIEIAGHTDNTGKAAFNQKLSVQRANAVKAYLIKKGIDASRLTVTGFGDTMPIADNKTTTGRKQNRRVEFKLSQ